MRTPHALAFLATLLLALPLASGVRAEEDETTPATDETPTEPADDAEELPPQPLLWVVEGEPTIYLFGTIHSPDERVKTFSKVVEDARAAADVLWTEIKLDMSTQMKAQQAALLGGGKTLKDVLPPEVYERATNYIAERGYPKTMLDPFKPWAVATTIQILDILPQLAQSKPLDATLYTEAEAAGKEVGGLETPEEQFGIFDGLSEAEQAEFLVTTLDMMEKTEDQGGALELITKAYLTGDPEQIRDMMYREYDPTNPLQKKLMEALLDQRNVRMVERMLERSAKAPEKTYFVAVGAAHYPGDKGILKLLEEKGKTVRRLQRDDEIEVPEKTPVPAAAD